MQREEGYYWVKHLGKSKIAGWYKRKAYPKGEYWSLDGTMFNDADFSEINENRIPAPDEPIVVNRTENSISYKLPKPSDREIEMSAQRAASMAANPFLKTDLGDKYEPSPYAEYKDQLLSLISEKWGVPKEEILKDISESPL